MSDLFWAARLGDDLEHTSVFADVLSGVLEVAAYAAAGAALVAAAGLVVVTAPVSACVLSFAAGVVIGVGMNLTGLDKGVTTFCDWVANAIFPPSPQAKITSGASKTFTNGLPSARAAGKLGEVTPPSGTELEQPEPSYLDMAASFFSEMWNPTVESPVPGAIPCPLDTILCSKHPPMPPQLLAEGSSKVSIEGQPAVRSGDRSTCEAKVVEAGTISSNVRIGGDSVVVRPIRSGKTPGVGLVLSVLMALRGNPRKLLSGLPCLAMGMVNGYVTNQVAGAATRAITGAPNPVHAATGAKVLNGADDLDCVLPGLLPFEWQRFYCSRDERQNGLFGPGWSVAYEVSVAFTTAADGTRSFIYTDEQSRPIDLGWLEPGDAAYGPGEGLNLRRDARTGALLIESADGLYRLFEARPEAPHLLRLSKLGDRNDNRQLLHYDAQGRLAAISENEPNLRVELHYDAAHPTRVARLERCFSDGRRQLLAAYRYSAQGLLLEVHDSNGQAVRRFTYDDRQRLSSHQLPSGLQCFYQWAEFQEVSGVFSRVVHHWTDEGEDYRLDYDIEAGITRVTDGLGRINQHQWNSQYEVTRFTDPLGQSWSFDWNDDRQLLAATAPDGARWQYDYDQFGNLCGSIDPLGRRDCTEYLGHWPLPTSETDAAGHAWQYQYDKRGNCTAEIDPLGHVTRYRYDSSGLPVEIIDASGKRRTLRWNAFGQLTEQVDCSGYPTRFAYDERGNLVQITDALGEITRYHYDAQGRLLQTQLADGRCEEFQRDAIGQLSAYLDPAGKPVRYRYDRRGQVRQRIDALGRSVGFEYDAYGRLLALSNENDERYRFTWDVLDRLTAQHDLDDSARHYRYDAQGNLIALAYTPAPHGTGLTSVPETPPAPIIHRFERDAVGRLTAKLTDDGRSEYRYDPLDRLTAIDLTASDGQVQSLAFAYDALGQLLSEQSAAGALQHAYDELGNLLETQLPDQRRIRRLYYGSGHLQLLSLDDQLVSRFERDRLHREVLRTQGQLITRSQYDRSGRLIARQRRRQETPVQLPAEAERRYAYDPSDNLIGRLDRDPANQREQKQQLHYDASGRIIASQDLVRGNLETYSYDAAANLLHPVGGDAASSGWVRHNKLLTYQDKRYRYDAFGRLVEKRSGRHQLQRLSYDAEHRVREVSNHDGSRVVMHYDPLGRRIGKRHYDARGALLSQTDFTWDGMRLLSETRNGRPSLYLYDEASYDPLARIDGQGEHARLRYYHNDPNGLPQQLTEDDGQCIWQASYQVWGNTLTEQQESLFIDEQNLRFQGQYLDRETGLHYNTFRFYDPDIGRFISLDPIGLAGGINLFQYAPEPYGWVDPWGWAKCNSPNGYKTGAVDAHGRLSPNKNRAAGHTNSKADKFVQSHHAIQDAWAKKNIFGYQRNSAPGTLLQSSSGSPHAAISVAQRVRRATPGGWNTTLKSEFNISYREMLDAGVSSKQARKALSDSYKYFDGIRSNNVGNPFFDI
ncbi:RHS repeat-associated core domain-containing protein [Pseudomonas sp. SH1-B]